jgi:hypothetical protein
MACVSAAAMDYSKRLREFADMMERASTRIRVALCSRPDMRSVLEEAKTEVGPLTHWNPPVNGAAPSISASCGPSPRIQTRPARSD